MLKSWFARSVVSVLLVFQGPASAQDPGVDAMGLQFVSQLPPGWQAVRGDWRYLDLERCFQPGAYCYGANPSSPYGFPTFGQSGDIESFRMDPGDAIVIFLRTPPPVRYFGFTQYLLDRGTDGSKPFGSLSDTLNHLKFRTLGSPEPGTNLFDQHAVVVWTADLNTLAAVKTTLGAQGIDPSQVNFLPIPIGLPLDMGDTETSDGFGMLVRTALPSSQADLDRYREQRPYFVVKVKPQDPPPIDPAPTVGYADEVSGVSEDPADAEALAELVSDIKSQYRRRFSFKTQTPRFSQGNNGLRCIAGDYFCAGDNQDALYSADTTFITVSQLTDVVIVAGVNHRQTGKAVYLNHSVYDTVHFAGITAVDDSELPAASALYHAGVTRPRDARVQRYRNLYAYAFSYDCGGISHCRNIPPPTPENRVGLEPGARFYVVGRSYLEPRTGVKPHLPEVIRHQTLVGKTR